MISDQLKKIMPEAQNNNYEGEPVGRLLDGAKEYDKGYNDCLSQVHKILDGIEFNKPLIRNIVYKCVIEAIDKSKESGFTANFSAGYVATEIGKRNILKVGR